MLFLQHTVQMVLVEQPRLGCHSYSSLNVDLTGGRDLCCEMGRRMVSELEVEQWVEGRQAVVRVPDVVHCDERDAHHEDEEVRVVCDPY